MPEASAAPDRRLTAKNVSVTLGRRHVLCDASLMARRGEVLALLGPNGAGKSTLLRACLGLVRASGSIQVDGQDLRVLSAVERARLLAYVPQRTHLRAALRVEEVVALGRYAHRTGMGLGASDRLAVEEALRTSHAEALQGRLFTQLSCGEQRRVLLARALSTGAEWLLLDEPTAALDVGQALGTYGLLRRLAEQGRGVVVVMHSLDDARRFADRAVLLNRGQVIASGAVQEVVSDHYVRDVYGVDLLEKTGLAYRACEAREL